MRDIEIESKRPRYLVGREYKAERKNRQVYGNEKC